jgi:hypothetical protein
MPTAQMSPGNQNSAVVHSAINADAVEPSGGMTCAVPPPGTNIHCCLFSRSP